MEMNLTIKSGDRGYWDMAMKRNCNGSKLNGLNTFSVWLGKKNEARWRGRN